MANQELREFMVPVQRGSMRHARRLMSVLVRVDIRAMIERELGDLEVMVHASPRKGDIKRASWLACAGTPATDAQAGTSSGSWQPPFKIACDPMNQAERRCYARSSKQNRWEFSLAAGRRRPVWRAPCSLTRHRQSHILRPRPIVADRGSIYHTYMTVDLNGSMSVRVFTSP